MHIHAMKMDGTDIPISVETLQPLPDEPSMGSLTNKQLKKVQRWIIINKNKIYRAWLRAQQNQDPRIGFRPWNAK